jgi:hypothetical protein
MSVLSYGIDLSCMPGNAVIIGPSDNLTRRWLVLTTIGRFIPGQRNSKAMHLVIKEDGWYARNAALAYA